MDNVFEAWDGFLDVALQIQSTLINTLLTAWLIYTDRFCQRQPCKNWPVRLERPLCRWRALFSSQMNDTVNEFGINHLFRTLWYVQVLENFLLVLYGWSLVFINWSVVRVTMFKLNDYILNIIDLIDSSYKVHVLIVDNVCCFIIELINTEK